MASQEPKTTSKMSQKSPGEKRWCSSSPKRYKCWSVSGGGFSTWDTGVTVSLSKSILLMLGRQAIFIFGKFFKSFVVAALFLGSDLTVYQTSTSKIITYLRWGEGLLLCSSIIFRDALESSSGENLGWNSKCALWRSIIGLQSYCIFSLMQCQTYQVFMFLKLWAKLQYFGGRLRVKGTPKCLKMRKRFQRMLLSPSTC